jgi:hypothetical protein
MATSLYSILEILAKRNKQNEWATYKASQSREWCCGGIRARRLFQEIRMVSSLSGTPRKAPL